MSTWCKHHSLKYEQLEQLVYIIIIGRSCIVDQTGFRVRMRNIVSFEQIEFCFIAFKLKNKADEELGTCFGMTLGKTTTAVFRFFI